MYGGVQPRPRSKNKCPPKWIKGGFNPTPPIQKKAPKNGSREGFNPSPNISDLDPNKGMAVLDLSKLHMYRFHYDTIKRTYGERARLLFTDTDSLCYHIQTDDIYADIYADKETYDLSGFDPASPYYDATNKNAV
jgi:hypothetical protein